MDTGLLIGCLLAAVFFIVCAYYLTRNG